MRKLGLILAFLMSFLLVTGLMAAVKETPVKLVVDGKTSNVRPAAFMRGDKAYLPLEATAMAVKATVKQDKAKKTFLVTSGRKNTTIRESDTIKANGAAFVSFDLMSKALDCSVKWDKSSKSVTITTSKAGKPGKPEGKKCPPSG